MHSSSGNTIGGGSEGARHIIAGYSIGVFLGGDSNVVAGNLIGTDVTGMRPLANGGGMLVVNAVGNIIGGGDMGARNVISANTTYGVHVWLGRASNNVIAGNFIGTDITGTNALGNGGSGIRI